ncbi:DUF3575 domain-containing protein [Christiangramia flava]|uniref:Uncharacterized protein n=1 Tax=Christiangramia flava JLT2011 TaxID=1229726 RepID=A0A1L7I2T0_9FLAO|nr:DUF3575 domain-containing protein [Christiangramia flava]APU67493.1 hypothetical protein GRFL_0769 [Christiangramia flava JLT2011]OSS40079.1 secreted protein [Christiangramia flava JLT2011]
MRKIFILALMLVGMNSFAQEQATQNSGDLPQTQDQFSLNFLAPSVEYELAIGQRSSLDFLAGLYFGYEKWMDEDAEFGIYPFFQTQYRYYYNFDKRLEKGKNIQNNSGNYISGVVLLDPGKPIIGDLEQSGGFSGVVGPAWGLQRVYGRHFKLNLNLGLGYGFDQDDSYLAGILGFQLGFKLGKQ